MCVCVCVCVCVFLITTMHCFRVFVNRSLMLEKVGFFGFDMDYTLAGQCTVVVAATLMAVTLYAGAAGYSFVSLMWWRY